MRAFIGQRVLLRGVIKILLFAVFLQKRVDIFEVCDTMRINGGGTVPLFLQRTKLQFFGGRKRIWKKICQIWPKIHVI